MELAAALAEATTEDSPEEALRKQLEAAKRFIQENKVGGRGRQAIYPRKRGGGVGGGGWSTYLLTRRIGGWCPPRRRRRRRRRPRCWAFWRRWWSSGRGCRRGRRAASGPTSTRPFATRCSRPSTTDSSLQRWPKVTARRNAHTLLNYDTEGRKSVKNAPMVVVSGFHRKTQGDPPRPPKPTAGRPFSFRVGFKSACGLCGLCGAQCSATGGNAGEGLIHWQCLFNPFFCVVKLFVLSRGKMPLRELAF